MPVLFVGHGTPMNAIEDNEFSRGWRVVGQILPKPRAILCVSAHWETWGTLVTAMDKPRTIHDFGGFPDALYEARYPAPGSPWLAKETQKALQPTPVGLDTDWGVDHGCWSVLIQMFPAADIPVVELSLDQSKSPAELYALAEGLTPLRRQGVLIVGSGNMVHNLGRVRWPRNGMEDFNKPFGFDWAIEANDLFKRLINERRHQELADYPSLGRAVQLAVPTPEHFLPLLYVLAVQDKGETVLYFNDLPVAGSLTMTSVVVDEAGRNAERGKELEAEKRKT
jgi:4,5-DOPA dioxygenase extradiol